MNVTSRITLNLDELRKKDAGKITKSLTFQNGDMEIVQCFRLLPDKIVLPRGAWSEIPEYVEYYDKRSCPKMPELDFKIKLDDIEKDERFKGQSDAVRSMFENEQGLIIRAPGTGKTQIALAFAASCKTRTLVLVHTQDILQQWLDYIAEAIPEASVGIIQGRKETIGHITIAMVQSIKRNVYAEDPEWWRQFGCVILDEAHHGPAKSFEQVLNTCPAKYRFGFTASATRADGMEPAMRWLIGPVIHEQKFSSPVDLKVVPVKTNFKYRYRGHWDWGNLVRALIADQGRNELIAEVVRGEIKEGNSVLVLSRRIEHLRSIGALVGAEAEILTGQRSRSDRKRILDEFRAGKIRCLLATQLADEALDVPRLNRVCLTHPGKHEGRIVQQIGRAIREHPEKRDAVIYDFVDLHVGVLKYQWGKRRATYRKLKIKIKKRNGFLLRKAA